MDLPPFRPTFVRRYCDFESCYVYYTEVFKYLTSTKTLIYLEVCGYDDYFWEVKTDMSYDPIEDMWTFGPDATYHSFFDSEESEGELLHVGASYRMAGHPEFV